MKRSLVQAAYSISHDRQFKAQDPAPQNIADQDTPPGSIGCVSCFFPSTRGVVEFLGDDGSTVLLAATGHIRDFIAQRMNEDGAPSARANLAPVTACIVAFPTGSAFESDLLVLERARESDPALHAKIVEQNRRALLVLCSESGTWRVGETRSLVVGTHERVVGPILSHKSASALGECLDDVFELCRFPKQLALAPHGSPCAYKQMGRCPAACDGSEPMHAYHERFNEAIAVAEGGVRAWAEVLRSRITRASAELDFERAQSLKRSLDQIEKLPLEALEHAGSLHAFACVCITPAWRAGWAMVWVLGGAGLIPLVAIEGEGDASLQELIESHATPIGFDPEQLERFSLVARHWFTKPARARRRRVTIIDLRDDDWAHGLAGAIADAQTPVDPGHEDEEHTHIKGE